MRLGRLGRVGPGVIELRPPDTEDVTGHDVSMAKDIDDQERISRLLMVQQ